MKASVLAFLFVTPISALGADQPVQPLFCKLGIGDRPTIQIPFDAALNRFKLKLSSLSLIVSASEVPTTFTETKGMHVAVVEYYGHQKDETLLAEVVGSLINMPNPTHILHNEIRLSTTTSTGAFLQVTCGLKP